MKNCYTQMQTTARLNCRSAPFITPETAVGVLENGTIVRVLDGSELVYNGHTWVKIKLNRKHFFVCKMWLEPEPNSG